MKTLFLHRVIPVVAIAMALTSQGVARSSTSHKLEGLINHYTAALDANGPWHISGEWSVWLKGNSGRADFSSALSMARADNAVPQPHTHHVTIVDGDFALTGTGFVIWGTATVTGDGNLAFTSPVEIFVTGKRGVVLECVGEVHGQRGGEPFWRGGPQGRRDTKPLSGRPAKSARRSGVEAGARQRGAASLAFRQRAFCNLQNLQGRQEFESHALRHPSLA